MLILAIFLSALEILCVNKKDKKKLFSLHNSDKQKLNINLGILIFLTMYVFVCMFIFIMVINNPLSFGGKGQLIF